MTVAVRELYTDPLEPIDATNWVLSCGFEWSIRKQDKPCTKSFQPRLSLPHFFYRPCSDLSSARISLPAPNRANQARRIDNRSTNFDIAPAQGFDRPSPKIPLADDAIPDYIDFVNLPADSSANEDASVSPEKPIIASDLNASKELDEPDLNVLKEVLFAEPNYRLLSDDELQEELQIANQGLKVAKHKHRKHVVCPKCKLEQTVREIASVIGVRQSHPCPTIKLSKRKHQTSEPHVALKKVKQEEFSG
mmetsp:Transcript_20548/g.44748  ORF Transcript_20548/g.44748 Transcript_20548/m.44748 type:complete len:249 (+) Transcript_20548:2981-3727(+)